MTNRERYITKRDEYDLLMTIAENIQELGTFCPITAVGGKPDDCDWWADRCDKCIQKWLNEEAEP